MKRNTFIQKLVALGGIGFLPVNAFTHYKKIYLLQCFIAGFRYYNGPALIDQLQEGGLLQLVREADNKYDNCAIALHWNNKKIGFIPADENEMLSRLLDANALELIAEITHLNKKVMPWENVRIAIYILKELPMGDIPEEMQYLTVLQTPEYSTYKRNNVVLSKLSTKESEWENDADWYSFFVTNSTNDSMYTIIHESDVKSDYCYGKDTGDYLLVNKNNITANSLLNNVLQTAEQSLGQLDKLFDKEGYIVVATKEIEHLVPSISKIANVTDKLGRHYIELFFG